MCVEDASRAGGENIKQTAKSRSVHLFDDRFLGTGNFPLSFFLLNFPIAVPVETKKYFQEKQLCGSAKRTGYLIASSEGKSPDILTAAATVGSEEF